MPGNTKKRMNIILGIITIVAIGIVINLFSDIFYDVFILGAKSFNSEFPHLYMLSMWTIFLSSFLSFLVFDFRSNVYRNRLMWYRFFNYYDENNPENRVRMNVNRIIMAIIWLVIKWAVAVYTYVVLVENVNTETGSAWVVLVITWIISKSLFRKIKLGESNI